MPERAADQEQKTRWICDVGDFA